MTKKLASQQTRKKRTGRFTEDDALFFMHIPKTAGTSVKSFLEGNFPVIEKFFNIQYCFLAAMRMDIEEGEQYIPCRYLAGHYPFRLSLSFIKKVHVITFLRDPIERTISDFRWLQKEGRIPVTFEAIDLPGSKYENYFLNFQTRWIADIYNCYDFQDERLYNLDSEVLKDKSLLVKATTKLRDFRFVGFTEELDKSLAALAMEFGWIKPRFIPRLNVAPTKPSKIDSELARSISSLVELDIELYKKAREMFPFLKYENLDIDLQPLPYALITMDNSSNAFLLDSWYTPEYDSGIGCWRWTGPGNIFSVKVPPLRFNELVVVINVTEHRRIEDLAKTCLIRDDLVLEPYLTRFENGYCISYAIQLNDEEAKSFFELKFKVATMLPENCPNGRSLGLPVKFIYIGHYSPSPNICVTQK